MANSTIDMYYDSRDSAYMLNSGYGRIYAWGSATKSETPTTVTVTLTVYTCGTSNSDPWRGPSWSGMSIYAGFSGDWGGYKAFSYNYEAVISTSYTKTFSKRADQYTVDLQIDTDGSLPTHFDIFTLGTLTVGRIVSYDVNYYDIDEMDIIIGEVEVLKLLQYKLDYVSSFEILNFKVSLTLASIACSESIVTAI